jgi:hypothetical protein
MMNQPTITPPARPASSARPALSARQSEAISRLHAAGVSFRPAFGNGDTPHYGL